MNIDGFIDILVSSSNNLLQAEGSTLKNWAQLKHTKQDLTLFLAYNLAEIQFKTKDGLSRTIICTSNQALIKVFSLAKAEDKAKVKLTKASFSSSSASKKGASNLITTWDLHANSFKTIYLKDWLIINFITITEDNILTLDNIINQLLK